MAWALAHGILLEVCGMNESPFPTHLLLGRPSVLACRGLSCFVGHGTVSAKLKSVWGTPGLAGPLLTENPWPTIDQALAPAGHRRLNQIQSLFSSPHRVGTDKYDMMVSVTTGPHTRAKPWSWTHPGWLLRGGTDRGGLGDGGVFSGRSAPDLCKKLWKGLGAKGQLGQRLSRGSHNNGLVQETVGSICVCLCVLWGWVCWGHVGVKRWNPEVREIFEGPEQ